MALTTHPKGAEGVYEDNLLRVAGVEVAIRKAKMYEDEVGSRGQGRDKEKQKNIRIFYFEKEKIRGPTRFEVRTATIPRQRHQKGC